MRKDKTALTKEGLLIHFFACSHGFGHLKRVASVVKELLLLHKKLNITIHCQESLFNRVKDWTLVKVLLHEEKVIFSHQLMETSPFYDERTSINSIDKWLRPILESKEKIQGIKVIDNDASLLKVFPDAVMMGSFLWAEVLEARGDKTSIELALSEIEILKKNKPLMLCINNIMTQGVRKYTQAVSLPWFCDKYDKQNKDKIRGQGILITGGGTIKQAYTLLNIGLELKALGLPVFADVGVYTHSDGEIPLFSYTDQDFSMLRLIICRPGIGIINDAIRYGLPLLAVEEKTNIEMQHNIARIEEMGIGKLITAHVKAEEIRAFYHSQELIKCQKCIEEQETGGAKKAAEWLLERGLRTINSEDQYE